MTGRQQRSISWNPNILLGYKSTFADKYNIRGIWYTVKQKIKEQGLSYGREEVDFLKMITPLEKYLDEIYSNIMTDIFNNDYHNIDLVLEKWIV